MSYRQLSTSSAPRPSLVPPDPHGRRTQAGPATLLLLGVAISIAAYVARGHLATTARAADVTPAALPSTRPLLVVIRPAALPRATPAAVDAFGSLGGPDESAAPSPKHDEPSPLRLQSIVIGSSRRVCMINDRLCIIGDTIDGARIESISRASVVVRRAGRASVIALPVAHP